MKSINKAFEEAQKEVAREKAAIQETKRIVYRYHAHLDKRKWIYRTAFAGDLCFLDIQDHEELISIFSDAWRGEDGDVRVMSDPLIEKLDEIDKKINALHAERKKAKEYFFHDKPKLNIEQLKNLKEKGVID